jgi:hypothetical protein
MNKRIKLPAQEWLGYDPEKGDIHGYTFEQMHNFAELIVNTCIDLLEHDARDIHPRSHDYCISLIKEHFGVEK